MMGESRSTVIVTGAAGNLGLRLPQQFPGYNFVAVDLRDPRTDAPLRFVQMNLEREESCHELMALLRQTRAVAVIHLAFVTDPVRAGVLDLDRMWRTNVAGTARVLEAISEVNRDEPVVQKFIFVSSAFVYGTDLHSPATEDSALRAEALPYAEHQIEAEKVVRQRVPALRSCSAYLLRSHLFAGETVEHYLLDAFRGVPSGRGPRATRMRSKGKKLTFPIPLGNQYSQKRIQFAHVDDVARLTAAIVKKGEPEAQRLTVLNVAGRGDPLTHSQCAEIARVKPLTLPGMTALRMVTRYRWNAGISALPPEALPYLTGDWVLNTDRLKKFLDHDYKDVIRFTVEEAFADSFKSDRESDRRRSVAVP